MGYFSAGEIGTRGLGRRPTIVSVIDVGSSKICCLIAALKPSEPGGALRTRTHSIDVLGFGHLRSVGVKSGTVTDLDSAEQAIRLAVDAAERTAGVTVDSLVVNITAGRLASEVLTATVAVDGNPIGDADIGRVLAAGRRYSRAEGRTVVHALPTGYSLDAQNGVADPRGMVGQRLGVEMHFVTADGAPLRNLEVCVNRCHLSVQRLVAAPYASGLSVLVDDEAELGCAVIDFGGGTTTMAVFNRGQFIHADAIAIGGRHVTNDVARGLSIRVEDAERLKTMYGSALAGVTDEREMMSVRLVGDDEGEVPAEMPRSALTRIIRPRVEEILELVRDRLNASGFAALVGRRIVLTGGASQLTGLAEAARRILARNVRLGRPLGIAGMPEVARGPAFATAVGLLIYPQVSAMEQIDTRHDRPVMMTGTGGYLSRVGNWIRESF
jgi:cell division protein FtsA